MVLGVLVFRKVNMFLISESKSSAYFLCLITAELEVQLSSSAAEVDVKLVELSSALDNSVRLLPQCVNHIHSQLEQCALLGKKRSMFLH